jgi:hypothetical protein
MLPRKEFTKRVQSLGSLYESAEARIKFFRRIFNIRKKTPDQAVVDHIMNRESDRLAEINEIWITIQGVRLPDERDVREHSFPQEVEDCNNFIGLLEILNRLDEVNKRYNEIKDDTAIGEEEREERLVELHKEIRLIHFAKNKFVIGSRASSIRESLLYRRRESIKSYTDDYLREDIFEIIGEEEVPVPTNPSIKVKLWRARLRDPDTGESVEVYLYKGGDSAKPKQLKEGIGIVNIKALAKIIPKDFSQEGEVKDYFRITVMPVNPDEIDTMRTIMDKTLTHPLSRDKETVLEEDDPHNESSSYKDKDIKKVYVNITPYALTDEVFYSGALESGEIRDVRENTRFEEYIPVGPIPLEVRTGKWQDIILEMDTKHETSHSAYDQMRTANEWDKFLPPDQFPVNWLGRARQKTRSIKETIRPEDIVLYMSMVTRKELGAVLNGAMSRLRKKPKASSPELSAPSQQ